MKFSVIIPTYNRIEFLNKAIESVKNQTCQDFEVIIVNDNPDEKNKIDLLASQSDKIKVLHHETSKGGNAARNTGILHSKGELLAFLDDDDIWLPEKLSCHLREHNTNPAAGLVFSDCLYAYNNKKIIDHVYSAAVPSNVMEVMGQGNFCPATSSIVSIRRECVEKCGLFDENLVSFQDWDYWFRIAHLFQFVHLPVVLVLFRQHLGNRTSHNEEKRRKGLNQIATKWHNKISVKDFSKNFLISIYYKNSSNLLLSENKFKAFIKSFKLLSFEVLGIRSIKHFIRLLLALVKN